MPFVTEELWQHLPGKPSSEPESIVIAKYPSPAIAKGLISEDAINAFDVVNQVAHTMRSLKQDYNLSQAKNVQFYVTTDEAEKKARLLELVSDIQVLGSGKVTIVATSSDVPSVT